MKNKRHAKILELIANNPITTQEELIQRLIAADFTVTQATVSRDIKELRLIKELDSGGNYRYSVNEKESALDLTDNLSLILSSAVKAVDYVNNMVIIKCHTGMANAVCVAIESLQLPGVVGTLAGDDTIFCAMRTEQHAADYTDYLMKLV